MPDERNAGGTSSRDGTVKARGSLEPTIAAKAYKQIEIITGYKILKLKDKMIPQQFRVLKCLAPKGKGIKRNQKGNIPTCTGTRTSRHRHTPLT